MPVDYDAIASVYDRRYDVNEYSGSLSALHHFLEGEDVDAAEIGCGSGHWLAELAEVAGTITGLDLSAAMLDRARLAAPRALLVRGRGQRLPFAAESFDRVFCINALHHIADADAFVAEARRTLRPGGGLLIIGLDPHAGGDQWWVYEYFPNALVLDRERYQPATRICELLRNAGFSAVSTSVVQRLPAERPFDLAMEQGLLDRRHTSQLQVIDDAHWQAGLDRIHAERPLLRADLRLYGTVGWLHDDNARGE